MKENREGMGEEEEWKSMTEILQTQGYAVNGCEDHWTVLCPSCGKEYEYRGFFDTDDVTHCDCGTNFKTERIWLDSSEKAYIK